MDSQKENKQRIDEIGDVLILKSEMDRHKLKTINAMMKKTSHEELRRSGRKLTTFWDLYELSQEEFQSVAPIVFLQYFRRIHLLSFDMLKMMNTEQVYVLFSNTKTMNSLPIPSFIIRYWLEVTDNCCYQDFIDRGIPMPEINNKIKNVGLHELLNRLYRKKQRKNDIISLLKTKEFYESTDMISLLDVYRFIYRDSLQCEDTYFTRSMAENKMMSIEGMNSTIIDDRFNICSYHKVIELLQNNYEGTVSDLEDIHNIYYIAYQLFHQVGFNNIDRLQYLYDTYIVNHQNLPSLKVDKQKKLYFYGDVIKYIKEQETIV